MAQRVRRSRSAGLTVVLAALATGAVVAATGGADQSVTGIGTMFARSPYLPQPDRIAEWTGNPGSSLSDDEIDKIAASAGIEVVPKFANGYDLSGQFADAKRLVSAGKSMGNPIKVFAYFSAAYWFRQNDSGWGTYAQSFSPDWLLTDPQGAQIPFYGQQRVGKIPAGHLLDLRNPDLRAWMVQTIVSWMKQAPFAGVAFDSATPIESGAAVRRGLGAGSAADYPALLCGGDTADCPAIDDWNAGLQDLLQQTTDALHHMGLQTMYNGIAPTVQQPNRNLASLKHADIAANESFCYGLKRADSGPVLTQTSFTADAKIMRAAAAQDKGVVQITNYGDSAHRGIGDYCLAGFLMGWQPGHSWYVFHRGYADALDGDYPEVPEQNLALGQPTAGYATHGPVLSRTFENGFVAVNPGTTAASVSVPAGGTAFASGMPGRTYAAGAKVTLPAHGSLYLLRSSYLNG